MKKIRKIGSFVLSCIAVFTLHCKFQIGVGSFEESGLLHGLHKLYGAFDGPEYLDILALAAVLCLFRAVEKRDRKFDVQTGILSVVFSVLLVYCISFRKYNSADLVVGNGFQVILSLICITGFSTLIYLVLRMCYLTLEKDCFFQKETAESFYKKYFFPIGFAIILIGWLPWILLNYPGTECPDSISQLQQFLGEKSWDAAHPPLSSFVMGVCFTIGQAVADANFGLFLYCLFQTLTGAAIFSYSMKKLQQMNLSVKWCTIGILFFALTPFWGTYAQWFEKDLLYAESVVLQTVCLLEILKTRQCTVKNGIFLVITSVLSMLLRNNGIYAIVPALVLLVFWLKGIERKRAFVAFLSVLLLYYTVTKGLYSVLLNVSGPSSTEVFSVPFQQTARYVCEFGDTVTDYEKEIIGSVLDYSHMNDYDPVISDPIKIRYNGSDLSEYMKVWFQMFWKQPGCYMAAFINKGFGYLAPVEPNIEAWIQIEYYGYMQEKGVHHVLSPDCSNFLMLLWNISMTMPLLKYLTMPGLYTWVLAALALLLWKHRKRGALILFVPSFINVLVCLASPLAGTMRYELPTVAVIPMLIGWTYYALHANPASGTGERPGESEISEETKNKSVC